MVGRPTKPHALRVLEGDTTKRSKEFNERYEHEKVVPGDFPVDSPPDWLTDEAKEEWDRLAKPLANIDMLKITDLQMFANYCQAAGEIAYLENIISKQRQYIVKDKNGRILINPAVRILSQRKSELFALAREFGLTPATRARLSVMAHTASKEEEDENSMASLLNRRPG